MAKRIITIIIIIVIVGLGYWIYQLTLAPEEELVLEGSKGCVNYDDCIVFGKTGDCNCGCYNKNNLPSGTGGDCFCAAPKSCKCVSGKCEGVFEEIIEEKHIEILPLEGELVEGKTINIKWKQKGLEEKSVNIYLFAYNETYYALAPKEEYRYGFGDYLVAERVSVSQEAFQWEIPDDLSQRYPYPPTFYKFNISSSEELSNWGVKLEDLKLSQSKEYFKISVSKE